MASKHYTKKFKLRVAKEAIRPENQEMEHILAQKYGIMPWTVTRWKEQYLEAGERAFQKNGGKSARERQLEKENAELKQEVEILKKAAAFLATVKHE